MPIIREGTGRKSNACPCSGTPSPISVPLGTLWKCEECRWVQEVKTMEYNDCREWVPVVNGWRFLGITAVAFATLPVLLSAPWGLVFGFSAFMTGCAYLVFYEGLYF